MLRERALAFVNRLLSREAWALARLRPFSGRSVRIGFGALDFSVTVDAQGLFHRAEGDGPFDVTVTLPADAPLRWLGDRASLLGVARIEGAADLAETLAFVFRNLHWDAEEDLSRLVGDIAARRLSRGARSLLAWQGEAFRRLGGNVLGFLTQERPVLVERQHFDGWRREVDAAEQAIERLQRRAEALAPTAPLSCPVGQTAASPTFAAGE